MHREFIMRTEHRAVENSVEGNHRQQIEVGILPWDCADCDPLREGIDLESALSNMLGIGSAPRRR